MKEIETICVVGGGSAGSLSALTLKRLLPGRRVISVAAAGIPVIGVGESTTAYLPQFLHRQLRLDQARFYREVKPSWKLGIRFVWGPEERGHFNYPFAFDLSERVGNLRKRAGFYYRELGGEQGLMSALMESDKSVLMKDKGQYRMTNTPYGYHIDNARFLAWLSALAGEHGVEHVEGTILATEKDEAGDITALKLDGDRRIEADLYIDCSGFKSLLLGQEMGAEFRSFAPALRCDTAIVGDIPRKGAILPYTSAETMENGWCWKIELPERVSVGYVHSSSHIGLDEARAELLAKNPALKEDGLRTIRFPSGRRESFWVGNVIGIGNASGFVEPLESTALHVICDELVFVAAALLDSDYRIEPAAVEDANQSFRRLWDATRDFLTVHYKFNTRSDSAFWRECRADTDLGGAEEIARLWGEVGPHVAMKNALPQNTLVQMEGYLAMFIGMQVPTRQQSRFDDQDRQDWADLQKQIAAATARAVPVREALSAVGRPSWRWGA
ncbi:MAG: tryptophan halogenase family protein [Paracoccaceae bacterium]